MSGERNVPEKIHAELGASSAKRWMECPGSVQLSRGLPNTRTEYAQEGTAAHAVAELALGRRISPHAFVGTTIEGVEVTDEMADAVAVYVDLVRELQAHATEHWIEERFTLAPLDPPTPMFGTADFVAYGASSRTLHVVDYKHGAGVVVEAIGNPQLRYYALGAVLKLGAGREIERVKMTIVQPRAEHADGVIRDDEITFAELIDFSVELLDAARATEQPDAPLNPGSWCRFCPAAGRCPALREAAQEAAQTDFSVIEFSPPPHPALLSPAEMAFVIERAPIIEAWLGAVRGEALRTIENGGEIPGYKPVEGRKSRSWKDAAGTKQWLEAQGYEPDEIETRKIKSPAQIEKLVGKKNVPADLIVASPGKITLARASDPRPAVALTAGSEFPMLPKGGSADE